MYRLIPRKVNDKVFWDLYETASNNTVLSSLDKAMIRKKLNFFKGGGGFNGWTPRFICG